MFVICYHTKFHIRSFIGSLVVTVKSWTEWKFFHICHIILHSKKKKGGGYLNKSCIFLKGLPYFRTLH